MKRLVTYTTLVLLLRAVRKFVVLVVTLLMESFATMFTRVRFVVHMDSHMGIQCRTAVECLTTGLTFVRFIRGVNDLMST